MGKITFIEVQKNKPNQTQSYLAPRSLWGLKGNLKKQSQFLMESNELKTSSDNEIREINRIGHLVKTNPNKPNII